MKRVLLVTEPIGGPASVQFDIVVALANQLRSRYEIAIYTPYIDSRRRVALEEMKVRVLTSPGQRLFMDGLLGLIGSSNESMLWAESWLREALFRKNSEEVAQVVRPGSFEYIINLSMTIPIGSDLWWIQGTPLEQTIHGMAGTNPLANLVHKFGKQLISQLDHRVMDRLQSGALNIVANSPYLRDLHRRRNVAVQGVVYSLTDLSSFVPASDVPKRDFALLYLGKETGQIDFMALKRAGVRIVGFGSKIPAGSLFDRARSSIDFHGPVSRQALVALYSNALFTLFPFTCEPMGLVPIESMACGTPVLTYNRQGPASTVIDGVTGWLVETPEELVQKAIEIWRRGETGISPTACIRRAGEFSVGRSVDELRGWIDGTRLDLASSAVAPVAGPSVAGT